jgi:hypothetical protein
LHIPDGKPEAADSVSKAIATGAAMWPITEAGFNTSKLEDRPEAAFN